MVLSGCLNMNEAYHFIDWRAVFLIAGCCRSVSAVQNSGLAPLLTQTVAAGFGPHGPIALLAGYFLIMALAVQIMPMAVVVVLMVPLAVNSALHLGYSPYRRL